MLFKLVLNKFKTYISTNGARQFFEMILSLPSLLRIGVCMIEIAELANSL